jgi:glycosyltransferase involved in cell wall biosynthesis
VNVGIDARKYFDFGIGTYIRNLAGVFDRQTGDQFTYFVSPDDAGRISRTHRGSTIVNRSKKYSVRELVSMSLQANRAGISVFHAPHYTLPFGLAMRRVVTIHDVIHLRFPEYFSRVQRAYARLVIGHACRAADAVIVDSEFAGRELVRFVPGAKDKLHVIPLGVSTDYAPGGNDADSLAFRRTHKIDGPFLLYVGSLKPHKNVGTLLRSFAGLRSLAGLQLVLVGEKLELNETLNALCAGAGIVERVRSLGWLAEPDLIEAYRGAAAVVLPSLYEGFGFPVLEAMACGTPVIASNAASIPEVMGDAGIMVDPTSEAEVSDAIRAVIDNPSLRESLREKGLRRARLFGWDRCAEATLDLYRSLE